jgi:hypothetical protein
LSPLATETVAEQFLVFATIKQSRVAERSNVYQVSLRFDLRNGATGLNEVDYRLPTLGDTAASAVDRIEKLFARTSVIDISDAIKLRAAQRGVRLN